MTEHTSTDASTQENSNKSTSTEKNIEYYIAETERLTNDLEAEKAKGRTDLANSQSYYDRMQHSQKEELAQYKHESESNFSLPTNEEEHEAFNQRHPEFSKYAAEFKNSLDATERQATLDELQVFKEAKTQDEFDEFMEQEVPDYVTLMSSEEFNIWGSKQTGFVESMLGSNEANDVVKALKLFIQETPSAQPQHTSDSTVTKTQAPIMARGNRSNSSNPLDSHQESKGLSQADQMKLSLSELRTYRANLKR